MNRSKNEVIILPQYSIACGIDIHKDTIMVYCCTKEGKVLLSQEYDTFSKTLREVVKALVECKVELVLMESTGIYWYKLYTLLKASGLNVVVANPSHIKQLPKQKTDKKDAKWLCKLAINRLVRSSFIAEGPQQELREFCRIREKYNKQVTATQNRIVKIIERANIKIRSVASSIRTKSCQQIISRLIEGETNPKVLAQLSKGRLRSKIPQMEKALDGLLSDSDISILKLLKIDLDHYETQLEKVTDEIELLVESNYAEHTLLQKVSGIGPKTSQSILAEMGVEMNKFESADHLTAWAGLAPGNNESAKKQKPVKSRKGNKHLKTTMIRIAWSAVRTKYSYWGCLYAELIRRMKPQKAIVAIARRMLKLIYKIIQNKLEYKEGGVALYDQMKIRRKQYLQKAS